MSSNYAGLNLLHGQITIPSDGDPAIAESVNLALRSLMDNSVNATTELAKRIDAVDGGTYTSVTGSQVTLNGNGRWVYNVEAVFNDPVAFTGDIQAGSNSADLVSLYASVIAVGPFTIGTAASHALTVNATSEFNSPVTFDDDTTFNSDVTVTNDSTLEIRPGSQIRVTGAMTLDGDGISCDSPANFLEDVNIDGNLTTGSSSANNQISGDTNFSGDITINGDVTISGGTLQTNGDTNLGNGAADSTTVSGDLAVEGETDLSGDLVFTGAGALAAIMPFSGIGRVPMRYGLVSTNISVGPEDGNFFIVTSSVSSMGLNSGTTGDVAIIIWSGSGSLTLSPSGGPIVTLTAAAPVYIGVYGGALGWQGVQLNGTEKV